MEPRREEQQKALEPSAGQEPKRFRIVKLEERIAPSTVQPMGKPTRACQSLEMWCSMWCDYPSVGFHCTHPPGHCKG